MLPGARSQSLFASTKSRQAAPPSRLAEDTQTPTELGKLQAEQSSRHALAQQTPSAQKPDAHSWALPQGSPVGFCRKQASSPSQK
jgi:hypothetical protein